MKSKAGFAAVAAYAGLAGAVQASSSHSKAFTFDFSEVKLPTLANSQKRAVQQDAVSSHVLTLSKKTGRSRAQGFVRAIRAGPNEDGRYDVVPSTNLTNLNDYEYVATIEFGGQPLDIIVDSGSSDTWAVQEGFACVASDNSPLDEDQCGFGPVFNGTFQHGTKPGVHFNISYGDGEFASGPMGYEDVTLAGLTVANQEVALVNSSYWDGDGITSGLMGLAYEFLTSEYTNSGDVQQPYSTIFSSMVNQSLVSSAIFSMATDAKTGNGQLAFGGLPPVEYKGDFTSTPIRIIAVEDAPGFDTHYTFYTIVPDAFVYGPNVNNLTTYKTSNTTMLSSKWNKLVSQKDQAQATQVPVIVDSGTTLAYVPTDLAEAYLALFGPGSFYNYFSGTYYAPCNATVPAFGVVIGGKTIFLDPSDLFETNAPVDNGDGTFVCTLGVADGLTGPYILGDTFMNSVVSVFDVGASEMRFATLK